MPRRSKNIEAPQPNKARRRAFAIVIGLVAWMFVIGFRLVQLQLNRHDELSARARNQQLEAIETSPTRGQVLDRQGRELARSIDTESFFADPREITDVSDTARRVAAITGLDRNDLASRLAEAKNSNKKFLWLVRRMDAQTGAKLDALAFLGIYPR